MNLVLNSNNFFSAWIDACHERRVSLIACWTNSPVFTSWIFTQDDCVIQAVGNRFELRVQRSYYSLDAILFSSETDLVPGSPVGTTWVRRIRVAFEHENHFDSGLFQEVSHLMITDCDLRVVVSYPRNELELNGELAYLHTLVADTDRARQIAENEAFLFIAGWRNEGLIDWWGFIYDDKAWRRIGPVPSSVRI